MGNPVREFIQALIVALLLSAVIWSVGEAIARDHNNNKLHTEWWGP